MKITVRHTLFRQQHRRVPDAGWGMVIWALSSIGCGLAPGFWTFLICRVIMGAGEASIVNLTGPYIDDVAPPEHKTLWFGILFLVGLSAMHAPAASGQARDHEPMPMHDLTWSGALRHCAPSTNACMS